MNSQPQHTQTDPDKVLAAITEGLIGLQEEFYGRAPESARTYFVENVVVCVMRGGFTRVEATLLEEGRGEAVLRQRREFQALMRDRYEAVIEHAAGRPVVGFMSGNQQDPDMMCEVFVLGPPGQR
jgi:uncharacterized protein YbcI